MAARSICSIAVRGRSGLGCRGRAAWTLACGGGGSPDAAPSALASSSVCTLGPDEWRTSCSPPRAWIGDACSRFRHHEATDPEYAALLANVRLHRDLAEYHFARDVRAADSVRTVLARFEAGARDAATMRALEDANRAFAGCVDHGILERWVATPLCGSETLVEGPARAPCASLNDECVRGFLSSARCCSVEPEPPGVRCEAGVCDGAGQCVDPSALPPGERTMPPHTWLASLTGGVLETWWRGEWTDIRLDGEVAVAIRSEEVPREDVPGSGLASAPARGWVAFGDAVFGLGAVLYEGPGTVRRLHVPRRIDSGEVCVVRGPLDFVPWLPSDCSSPEISIVACAPASSAPAVVHPGSETISCGPRCRFAQEKWETTAPGSPRARPPPWTRTAASRPRAMPGARIFGTSVIATLTRVSLANSIRDWCADFWDQCHCNGRETCEPGTGPETDWTGCQPAAVAPCDADFVPAEPLTPCSTDAECAALGGVCRPYPPDPQPWEPQLVGICVVSNRCTREPCCETSDTCRDLLGVPAEDRERAQEACRLAALVRGPDCTVDSCGSYGDVLVPPGGLRPRDLLGCFHRSGGCAIHQEEQCVTRGTSNADGCAVCDPDVNVYGWTPLPNGTHCGRDGYPDECRSGRCVLAPE